MNQAVAVPAWAAMITAILLIAGAAITLIGALGLLRLRTFYERVHAPTLGTTLGTGCIVMASMVYFSAVGSRPILHELLILLFVTVTTPITLMILVRAAVSRDTFESRKSASEEDKRHGHEVTT
jgi:multicomponent K+:H+ antiporter subunit G